MNTKPITPKVHGVMDYALASMLLVGPPLLGLNKKATNVYRGMAANLLTYTAITDFEAGIKPVISLDTHKKVDYGNLAVFAAAFFMKSIQKDKKALAFHAAVTTIAVGNVLMTDWDAIPLLDY